MSRNTTAVTVENPSVNANAQGVFPATLAQHYKEGGDTRQVHTHKHTRHHQGLRR